MDHAPEPQAETAQPVVTPRMPPPEEDARDRAETKKMLDGVDRMLAEEKKK